MPTVSIGANSSADFAGAADTQLREIAPTTNYASGTDLEVTKYDSGDWTTALLKFTGLSSIPADATVTAVSIFLYQFGTATGADGTYVVAAKRLLRDWVPAEATWDVWSTGNNWTSGGAFGNASDRNNVVAFESAGLGLTSGYVQLTGNATAVAEVQAIVEGSASNYGWMLERTDAADDLAIRAFRSSEGTDEQRPYLVVTYTLPDGVGFTPGAGATLATDDVGGSQYQRQKWTHGDDGSATDTSAAAPLPVQLRALASGGATPYRLVSTTGDNATSVKGSTAVLYGVLATNTNSSARYVKLYDRATSPVVGTSVPAMTIPVARLSTISLPQGVTFPAGLAIATTTGAADSDTGGVAANELVVTLVYR